MPNSAKFRALPPERAILPLEAQRAIMAVLLLDLGVRDGIDSSVKWSLYLRVLWETGLRPSEGLSLKAADVSPTHLLVRRLKRKGHPEDRVPIQAGLGQTLQAYAARYRIRPKARLFPNTIQAAQQIFQRVKHHIGLRPELTLHSFRHGFATHYLRSLPPGQSPAHGLAKAQRALGHSRLETTGVYLRATYDDVREDIEGMDFRKGGKG